MEIEKCDCGDPAIRYYNIQRHYMILPNGRQLYSDKCMNPNCNCQRAAIVKRPEAQKAIQEEKHKWARVIQEALA